MFAGGENSSDSVIYLKQRRSDGICCLPVDNEGIKPHKHGCYRVRSTILLPFIEYARKKTQMFVNNQQASQYLSFIVIDVSAHMISSMPVTHLFTSIQEAE